MKFNENLKKLRETLGKNMRQVSQESSIPYDNLGRYERGECEPNLENLILLAKYYHVSLDYLLTGETIEKIYISKKEYKELEATKRSLDTMYRTLNAITLRNSIKVKGE